MFVIYSPNFNMFIHIKDKIVTFESIDEAKEFLQNFTQYSMTKSMIGSPLGIQSVISFFDNVQIEPFTDKITCESITWKEYRDSKEKNNG